MTKPRKKQPLGQTIGGVLFGFEQQVLRTVPPARELVHHARPDDPLPAADGGFVTIGMPDDEKPLLPSAPAPARTPPQPAEAVAEPTTAPARTPPEPAPEPGADEP